LIKAGTLALRWAAQNDILQKDITEGLMCLAYPRSITKCKKGGA